MVLNFDLNATPEENNRRVLETNGMGQTLSLGLPAFRASHSHHHELDNDDVIIISARAFAEAMERPNRRRRRTEVIYDNSPPLLRNFIPGLTIRQLPSATLGQAGPTSQEITPGRHRWTRSQQKASTQVRQTMTQTPFNPNPNPQPNISQTMQAQAPPNPQPNISRGQYPQLTCPICISPLDEATTTKCGHLFCKECITTAISVQKRCPTCRRKLRQRDTLRVYINSN